MTLYMRADASTALHRAYGQVVHALEEEGN